MSRTSMAAAAMAVWLGTAVPVPWWWAFVGTALLVVAAAPLRRPSSSEGSQGGGVSRLRLGVVLVALALTGGGLSGARIAMRDQGVLSQVAGGVEKIDAVVVSEPRTGRFDSWVVARVERFGGMQVRERVLLRMSEPPQIGARLHFRGRVQSLPDDDFGTYLRSLGVGWRVRPLHPPKVRGDPRPILRVTSHVRDRLRSVADSGLSTEKASLLTGLVTGDSRGRPSGLNDVLTASGLRHLVVVSGRHTALFLAGVLSIAWVLRCPFRTTRVVTLAALAWFVVLVRWQPSVLRAATVAAIVLIADLLGRDRDHVHLLAVAVILLLFVDPLLGRQLGFVLSVSATAGVLVVAPSIHAHVKGPPWFRFGLAAAIGAQLAVAPVLFAQDEAVPVAGIVANLVAAPAAALAQVIGSAAAMVALIAPTAAAVLVKAAALPLGVVLVTAQRAADAPALTLDGVLDARALWVTLAGVAGIYLARRYGRRRASVRVVATIVAVAALVLWNPRGSVTQVDALTVTFLDVGQGDAVLVEAPDDDRVARMLVDAGAEPFDVARQLRRRGIGTLDVAVLSHSHHDHSGGMAAVLQGLDTGVFASGPRLPADRDPDSTLAANAAARGRGIPLLSLRQGTSFGLGAVTVTVLSPDNDVARVQTNDRSVVIRIDSEDGSVLLPGDAEEWAQSRLLRQPDVIDVDVLKVPHHGGATNANEFLAATTPQVAVISAGAGNDYGHPAPSVLADLQGTQLWRTDRHGEVRIELTPGGIVVTQG